MNVWVIYDIAGTKAGDKRRRKIIKEIESFGLYRVQKSVFLGNIEKNRIDELVIFSEDLIDKEHDSVYLFPICKEDFDAVKIIGKGFDKELVTGKIDSLIF
jgi:CRISPR-associated protein Cas2